MPGRVAGGQRARMREDNHQAKMGVVCRANWVEALALLGRCPLMWRRHVLDQDAPPGAVRGIGCAAASMGAKRHSCIP